MKVIVIGGGAAGLMAAVTAARDNRVTVLERAPRVGRKLAVTGNGRCNLTNLNMGVEHYHGEDPEFVIPALRRFGVGDTLELFRRMGLITVAEASGRVYPHSDQAGSVVDVLRLQAADLGVELRCEFFAHEIRPEKGGFRVMSDTEELFADRVIVAAGGAAGGNVGGSEAGYTLLARLGHTRTRLYPSLVQLRTDNSFTRPLKGVRADGRVEIISRGRTVAAGEGEIQFTDYGISGPAVFDVSRAAVTAGECSARLDLLRDVGLSELTDMLRARLESSLTAENLLTGTVHNKIGRTVVTRLGYPLAMPVAKLTEEDIGRVARAVKSTELKVTGSMGMNGAQVTAGGIRTGEVDPETMESRLAPGLFICGEVLDVDGDCGGYNLQWAWSSGRLAGRLGGV